MVMVSVMVMIWKPLSRLFHELLAPSGRACLTCGTTMRSNEAAYPEICWSCADSIPWIRSPRCPICGRSIGCPDCTRPGMKSRPFVLNRSAVVYDARMRDWLAMYKYRGHEAYAPLLARMMGQAYKTMASELTAAEAERMAAAGPSGMRHAAQHQPHEQKHQQYQKHQHQHHQLLKQLMEAARTRTSEPWRIDAVTFVPLSSQRLAERGFNQAEVLASGAAAAARVPLIGLLERLRDTEKQSSKKREQRLIAMRGVFRTVPEAGEVLSRLFHEPRRMHVQGDLNPLRLLLVDDIYTTGSTAGYCTEALIRVCTEARVPVEVYSLTWARS